MLARCETYGPAKVVSLFHDSVESRPAGTVIGYSRSGRHESRRELHDAPASSEMTLNTRARIGEDLRSLLNGGGSRRIRSICADTFVMDTVPDSPFGGPDAPAVFQRVAGEIAGGLAAHPVARSLVILAPVDFVFDQDTLGTMVRNYLTENVELMRVLRGCAHRRVTVVLYGSTSAVADGTRCDSEIFENLEVVWTLAPVAWLFGALPAKDPFVFPASWLSNVALEFEAPVIHAVASDSSGVVLPVTVRSESLVTLDGVYLNNCTNSAVSIAVMLGQLSETKASAFAGVTGRATLSDTGMVSCEEVPSDTAVSGRLRWIGVHNLVRVYWNEHDSYKAATRDLSWTQNVCRWIDRRAATRCAQELEATLARVHRETSVALHRVIVEVLIRREAETDSDPVVKKIAQETRASLFTRRTHPDPATLRQSTFATWDAVRDSVSEG
jgi:hypothetical protein